MADSTPVFAPSVTEPNTRTDAPVAPKTDAAPVAAAEPDTTEAAPTLAQIKAERRAGAAPKADAQPAAGLAASSTTATAGSSATPAAGTVEPSKTEPAKVTASIDMDPADLGKFAALSKEARQAKQALKEAEAKLAEYARFSKVQELAKAGKHYDAAREAGIDVDAALHDLLGIQAAAPDKSSAVLTDIEAKAAKALELAESIAKAEQAKADAAAKAAKEAGTAKVVSAIQAATDRYANLGRSTELISLALAEADSVYEKALADAREAEVIGPKDDLPDETKNKLLLSTLDRHEQKWAGVFGSKPAQVQDPRPGIADVRGGVAVLKQPGDGKPLTLDEVKMMRRKGK